MTSRLGAAIAAGALALGILVGSASTIIIGSATSPRVGGPMGDLSQMSQMMGAGMMDSADMMDSALHRAHHGGQP